MLPGAIGKYARAWIRPIVPAEPPVNIGVFASRELRNIVITRSFYWWRQLFGWSGVPVGCFRRGIICVERLCLSVTCSGNKPRSQRSGAPGLKNVAPDKRTWRPIIWPNIRVRGLIDFLEASLFVAGIVGILGHSEPSIWRIARCRDGSLAVAATRRIVGFTLTVLITFSLTISIKAMRLLTEIIRAATIHHILMSLWLCGS